MGKTARRALALGGLLLVVVLVEACSSSRRATAYQYRWDIFFDSLFAPDARIIHGIWLTVSIAVTGWALPFCRSLGRESPTGR